MKTINYILLIIALFLITSCNKKEISKKVTNPLLPKKEKNILKDLKRITTDKNFNAIDYEYKELTLKIPETFKKKEENIFFEEDGTNLSIIKIRTLKHIDDYIKDNYQKLKSDYSNTIKEEENININNQFTKHIKYIIDRKKYLIQIETVLIPKNKYIYAVIISGKKKHIDLLLNTINNIFSTIKIKDE
jgi:hypothetical protein